MKKLTVNEFFWFATQLDRDLLNADNTGNMMITKGWEYTINNQDNLIITTMPKQTFCAEVKNYYNGKSFYLKADTVMGIIKEFNLFYTRELTK